VKLEKKMTLSNCPTLDQVRQPPHDTGASRLPQMISAVEISTATISAVQNILYTSN